MLKICALVSVLGITAATSWANPTDKVLDNQVLPGFSKLAFTSSVLAEVAEQDCDANSEQLREAYSNAFDAWIQVSHLRFGPTETDNRGFALAFWPDSRSSTPRTLMSLINEEDSVVDDPKAFKSVSIAGKGFYALEYLLHDDRIRETGSETYRCRLVQAIATDIARTAQDINSDWRDGYADQMREPRSDGLYQNTDEVLQEFYKALTTGLQINDDMRLGRPLGTFDKPRPNRAEARRSNRSLRHLQLSLVELHQLAGMLAIGKPEIESELDASFAAAIKKSKMLDDPNFSKVATPSGRIRVEALQQSVSDVRSTVTQFLGPALGVTAGFNSLDGD